MQRCKNRGQDTHARTGPDTQRLRRFARQLFENPEISMLPDGEPVGGAWGGPGNNIVGLIAKLINNFETIVSRKRRGWVGEFKGVYVEKTRVGAWWITAVTHHAGRAVQDAPQANY